MSIYATLWRLQFPSHGDDHTGCEWIEVSAQGVPAHIGTPTPGVGNEGEDPYASFLPPATAVPTDDNGQTMRAVVFVTPATRKGTDRSAQEYVSPLLVLSGLEYATIPFGDLHDRICNARGWRRWSPLERLAESTHGQLLFERAHPRADGTTHLLREPLELIEKLSIRIPPPRVHTRRCHGLLAPHAGWRSLSVPRPGEGAGQAGSGPAAGESARPGTGSSPVPAEPAGRQSWAALLARVFALDVFQCPRCGGRRRIVGVHTGGERLRVMLERLGLVSASPSAAPSRSPPRRGE